MSDVPDVRRRPLILPPDPPLATDGVRLRPLALTDSEAVYHACQDAEIGRWTTIPQPYLREHATTFLADTVAAWEQGREPTFAMVDPATGELLGCIGLRADGSGGHAAEIGYWTAPAARGRGLTTEAVRLVSRWALVELGFERISLLVYVGNAASARVAEKAGYQREGILRRHALQRGEPRDCIVHSLIRADLDG
jgi:RimJ/RimL family protein N-acetyltransferase